MLEDRIEEYSATQLATMLLPLCSKDVLDSDSTVPQAMPLPWLYRVCLSTVLISGLFFILIMLSRVPIDGQHPYSNNKGYPRIGASSLVFPEHGGYPRISASSLIFPKHGEYVNIEALNIDVLEVGAIPETVKTLVIRHLTKDMVIPTTLENLVLTDARYLAFSRPLVRNLFISYHQAYMGKYIGTHYIYSIGDKIKEEHMDRDRFWIEEENTVMRIGHTEYYVAKRIPKPVMLSKEEFDERRRIASEFGPIYTAM